MIYRGFDIVKLSERESTEQTRVRLIEKGETIGDYSSEEKAMDQVDLVCRLRRLAAK